MCIKQWISLFLVCYFNLDKSKAKPPKHPKIPAEFRHLTPIIDPNPLFIEYKESDNKDN